MPTVQILYTSLWPGGKMLQEKSGLTFFHPDLKGNAKLWTTFISTPDLKLGSFCQLPRVLGRGSESFHTCTNPTLKFYRVPFCRKTRLLPLKLAGLTWEVHSPWGKVGMLLWTFTQLSFCFRVNHFRARIVLQYVNWVGVSTTYLIE